MSFEQYMSAACALLSLRSRIVRAAACAAFLLGAWLIGSSAEAQSDPNALAPWQAPPGQRTSWQAEDPGPMPVDDVRPGRLATEGGCTSCGGPGLCEPSDQCEEGGCDFSRPWLCGFEGFTLRDRLWFRGEYLSWWTKDARTPALASTGILNQTGTDILFGGDVDSGSHSGGRITLGYWLSPCNGTGMEITSMFLGSTSAGFHQSSDGSAILARPYFDTTTDQQSAIYFSNPTSPFQRKGGIDIDLTNELSSVEVLFRQVVLREPCRQLDFLIGYRYARFREDLSIDSRTTLTDSQGSFPVGSLITMSDRFGARNEFNGAEIGFVAKSRYCRWSLEMLTKLAMGGTRSRATVSGASVVTVPGPVTTSFDGGLLALPSNMDGSPYTRNSFSVMPEIGITLGYDITCQLKATVGYTFLYWSSIVRPGDQIDTNVNTAQLFGGTAAAPPTYRDVTTDFWAHGVNVGLDYRF